MNIDIRLSLEFFSHPKTKKLQKRLGIEGVVALLRLWAWTAANRADGLLSGLDAEDVELAADWDREEGTFVNTLLQLRLLDEDEEGFCIHDWTEHQMYASKSKEREDKAKKAAQARWGTTAKAPDAEPDDAPNMLVDAPSIAPSMPVAQLSNAPETRIQEEKKENTASASPAAEPSPMFAAEAAEKPCTPEALPKSKSSRAKAKFSTPPDGEHYRAKSGRFLTGRRLEAFDQFWADFAFAKGKAEAADAWLDIPQLTAALVERIRYAAQCEAMGRPDLAAKGQTPKWAQGWLNSRRWEDYEPPRASIPQARAAPEPWELSPEEIERRRQIGLEQAHRWRENRKQAGAET